MFNALDTLKDIVTIQIDCTGVIGTARKGPETASRSPNGAKQISRTSQFLKSRS